MLSKIKEGILLGIGMSVGMFLFSLAMSLLTVALSFLMGAAGAVY